MKLREDTVRIQEQLGKFCRTGVGTDIPGVTPNRLHHYRRLINNVVRDSLDSAFPITLAALGEDAWDRLVQEFFASGNPSAPQIWRLPYEFYLYHARMESGAAIQKPYLEDLLYFEWMEIEVYNMPDRTYPSFEKAGNVLKERLAFNPEFEIFKLDYPVHLHPAEKAIELKGEYYVLVFRLPESGYVKFLDLSAMNTYILTRLVEEDLPVNDLKGEFAGAVGIESGKYLDEALEKFISDLMAKELILGFKR